MKKVIILKFEVEEDVFNEQLDSETIVNDIQDHLQHAFGDVFDWHNNDPDVEWKEIFKYHKLLEQFDEYDSYGEKIEN